MADETVQAAAAPETKVETAVETPAAAAPAPAAATPEVAAPAVEAAPEYVLKSDFDALLARIENFNLRSAHRI